MSNGALQDVRVLDLSRVLAGPYCTMVLGDYGADIVKIEEPGSGDGTRSWGPPWVGDQSAYYLCANRNKRSITINLKSAAGIELIRRLALVSDVVIENFKPGTMARFGLDYPALAALNPRLIYCSLTGYGQTGPYRDRPGYDFVIQAQGGLMSITGAVDGEPAKVGVAIADITTGLFAATAILAALHARTLSGCGQYIDVALLDSQIAWLANVAQNYLATGKTPARHGNAHPSIVPYETFPTADGELALAVGTDEQYRRFCELTQRMDLYDDPRFRTNAARVEHRTTLIPLLRALFQTRATNQWIDLLLGIGVPAGPINSVAAAIEDPHVQARNMVQAIDHPTAGAIKVLGPVAKFSRTPAAVRRAPPPLGFDTKQVLHELLGMSVGEISELAANGAI